MDKQTFVDELAALGFEMLQEGTQYRFIKVLPPMEKAAIIAEAVAVERSSIIDTANDVKLTFKQHPYVDVEWLQQGQTKYKYMGVKTYEDALIWCTSLVLLFPD